MKLNFLFVVFFLVLFFSQTKWVVEEVCPNGNPIIKEPYGKILSEYLVGCHYEKKFFNLNNSLLALEKGLLENQSKLQSDLKNLYDETENEFTSIDQEIGGIRNKTDRFEVKILGDGVLNFIPKSSNAITIKKLGFWKKSGGHSERHSGNPRYSFNVVSEGDITITLHSKTDSYLFLLDESGKILAKNDDGAEGSNSKIKMNLGRGRFIIVSATYKEGKSDSFSVKVKGKVNDFQVVK
jgi:hypothetical protein